MTHVFTVPPGAPLADLAAAHILAGVTTAERARAVIFVPTRRAAVSMRAALGRILKGEVSLLPRILPLADMDEALLTLLGTQALDALEQIPAAMGASQQLYLLVAQVRRFLEQRGGAVTLEYPLALAEDLIALEEQCARAGVQLTEEALRAIFSGNMATHWEQSLAFLTILANHWPALEQALGLTTQARREVLLLRTLTQAWQQHAPDYPVFVVGSTASQDSTAALLQVIAGLPLGAVILPGVDPAIDPAQWASIASGHPLFHVKQFLERISVPPSALVPLGAPSAPGIWAQALAPTDTIPDWRNLSLAPYDSIRLVPCQHPEQEARTIALLLREALETPGKRTALITPDEGLMGRVAALMKQYGVTIDRLERGTLAQSDTGSLWTALMAALAEPERLIHIRSLLHHPLVAFGPDFLHGLEPYWYGVAPRRVGQLPKLPEPVRMLSDYPKAETLVRELARLARADMLPSQWVQALHALLKPVLAEAGAAADAVEEALFTLNEADILGAVAAPEFIGLLQQLLQAPLRHGGVEAHPQLTMLTPIEARLEQFDRVILGAMSDAIWPGTHPSNAWLNLAAQAALGLPPPSHHVSLMAHDVLMLGSMGEVFLTWPARDAGGPATRSRFIERLVTLLAMHGIDEDTITARHYPAWGDGLFAAAQFAPALPPEPRPERVLRPTRLPVSALDMLFSDPYSIYARYVLNLRPLEAIDAEAQASDFGSLAHKAIQALTQHWNSTGSAADAQTVARIAEHALRDFADQASAALFWRTRLLRALQFVNEAEKERRAMRGITVKAEVSVEATLPLDSEASITLHGRIDRLEEQGGKATLADYKTGEIPSFKKINEGQATQLLAYAMLLTDVEAVEYWRLPHARHAGEIAQVAFSELEAQGLPEQLKTGLREMLEEAVPFLATPGRIREYDGISRYDEWAGS